MDMSEKEYVAKVINYFCGTNMVTPDRVTDSVAAVAYEALQGANTCWAAMDMVPRPTYKRPGLKYIVKQLVGIGKRIAEGDDDIYYLCKLTITVKYRSIIRLALAGYYQ
jgi:hypothetical protein